MSLPECTSCGRRLRPHRTRIADYPGTVARSNDHTCQSCRRTDRPGPSRRPSEDYLRLECERLIAARRRRGVPASGKPVTPRYVSVAVEQRGRTRLETQHAAMWKFRGYRMRKRILTAPPIGVWEGGTYYLYARTLRQEAAA